jgi:hypothetical protein
MQCDIRVCNDGFVSPTNQYEDQLGVLNRKEKMWKDGYFISSILSSLKSCQSHKAYRNTI